MGESESDTVMSASNAVCLPPQFEMDDITDEEFFLQSTEDVDQRSLAERRQRRENRQLPKRYREICQQPRQFQDILPQPLPHLPPEPVVDLEQNSTSAPPLFVPASPRSLPAVETIKSPRNAFGLLREYCSTKFPSHDPEDFVGLEELSDGPVAATTVITTQHHQSFRPYPNESSFLLGEWYWSGGAQKSRESFSDLLDIVGSPEFRPEDVRHTSWTKINETLAKNNFDDCNAGVDGEAEWMNEDAGWKKSPVSISVPFHSRTKTPGPQNYHAGHLYHRSLVSVIREKLLNPHDHRHFHHEPFKLFWQHIDASAKVRVHGELYTSSAFLDAHYELQESPREPECKLPRVVVALMFWSDATHLTSFGTAKLWPCYLFFGNESKYRRCKPSCNLCNHVAYFQAVSIHSSVEPLFFTILKAPRCFQRLCVRSDRWQAQRRPRNTLSARIAPSSMGATSG